jgi:membrane protease YdiL (CAAX protease family)
LGWVALAIVAATVCLIPLSVAYHQWSKLSGIVLGGPILESLGYAAFSVVGVVVLLLAARRAGWSGLHYFGLVWPHWRYIAIGFAVLAAEATFNAGLFHLLPLPDDSTSTIVDDYRAVIGNPVALALFWLSMVVIAPVSEEIAFRGFIMRGWLGTRLGVAGSILLVSLFFTAIHGPQELAVFISLFVGGLLLGIMRWISGSIVPSILMHATWNLGCVLLMALSL